MLHKIVQAKTGYIPPNLWREALAEAKHDVQAHPIDFSSKSKAEKLQYIADVMAVYILMIKLRIEGR